MSHDLRALSSTLLLFSLRVSALHPTKLSVVPVSPCCLTGGGVSGVGMPGMNPNQDLNHVCI